MELLEYMEIKLTSLKGKEEMESLHKSLTGRERFTVQRMKAIKNPSLP